MKTHILNASERTGSGKSDTKRLRREGFIPATIYSRERASQNIQIPKLAFDKEFPNRPLGASLELDFGTEKKLAIVKHIEVSPVKNETLHVEFQQLTAGEAITVEIPLILVHREKVETTSTVVQQLASTIHIEAMPENLIDNVTIDLSELTLDAPIHVSDLPIASDKKFKIHTPQNTVIVQLNHTSKIVETDEEAEEADMAVEQVNE